MNAINSTHLFELHTILELLLHTMVRHLMSTILVEAYTFPRRVSSVQLDTTPQALRVMLSPRAPAP